MTRSAWTSKRYKLWVRDRGACHYCGEEMPLSSMTVDHVWPLSKGGSNATLNLVACCAPCNHAFGDETDKCDCRRCVEATRVGRESVPGRKPAVSRYSMAEVAGYRWTREGWRPYDNQAW